MSASAPLPERYHFDQWQPRLERAESLDELLVIEDEAAKQMSFRWPESEAQAWLKKEVARRIRLHQPPFTLTLTDVTVTYQTAAQNVLHQVRLFILASPFIDQRLFVSNAMQPVREMDQGSTEAMALALFGNDSLPLALVNETYTDWRVMFRLTNFLEVRRPAEVTSGIHVVREMNAWGRAHDMPKEFVLAVKKLDAQGLNSMAYFADHLATKVVPMAFPQVAVYWRDWEAIWQAKVKRAVKNPMVTWEPNRRLEVLLVTLGLDGGAS